MTQPVLTYFDFPGGRGEAARLALHIAGVEWTDDRFSGPWPDKKPSTPFGGLPVLRVAGKGTLSQSNAILGYIGRTYGLLPEDPWEAAQHVALMNAIEEMRAHAKATSHEGDDQKRKAREAFASGYFQRWTAAASAQIQGPYFGGAQISVADLKLFVVMRGYLNGVYDHIPADVLAPFPKIAAHVAAVEAHPRVADWLLGRSPNRSLAQLVGRASPSP